MENKIVIIIGHRLQTMTGLYVIRLKTGGVSFQQGSYEELIALDGILKTLSPLVQGEFSSTIEEQLQTGKSFDIQDRDELDYSISIDKKDAYVLENDTRPS